MKQNFSPKALFLFLCLTLSSEITQAAIGDAPEILPQGNHSASLMGELILNNPSGEGAEARYKIGLEDHWNAQAILGTGSKNRKFRLGAETVYNIVPDADGQPSISGAALVQYLRRINYGSLQIRLSPLISKIFEGLNGLPMNIYTTVPFTFEFHQGSVELGTQFIFGGLFDVAKRNQWFAIGEAGIKLSKAESYALVGLGLRFGEGGPNLDAIRGGKKEETNDEYRTEDFK